MRDDRFTPQQADLLAACELFIVASPLPMAMVEGAGHIIRYANPAFCRLSGRSEAELRERAFADVAPVGESLPLLDRVYRTGKPETQNFKHDAGSNRLYWSYAMWPIGPQDGRPITTIIQVSDTTPFLLQAAAINEALILTSVRQHELTEEAEGREQLGFEERQRLAAQVDSTGQELRRTEAELQALTSSLLTAQEEERRRIARELHDDIAQRLAIIEIELTRLRQKTPAAETPLSSIIRRITALSTAIRNMSHDLHPSMLEGLGLEVALRGLCEEWERIGGVVRCIAPPLSRPVPIAMATVLYRITQEALRNVQKHAGDARVTVKLSESEQSLHLLIADDGSGFDSAVGSSSATGMGLISMRERAALLNGRVTIRSAPGRGTIITANLPWPPAEAPKPEA